MARNFVSCPPASTAQFTIRLPLATKLSIGVDHSGDYMPSHFSIYEPLLASVVRAVLGIRQTSADPHAFVLMG
jgi:hypothetical protein